MLYRNDNYYYYYTTTTASTAINYYDNSNLYKTTTPCYVTLRFLILFVHYLCI